MSNNPSVSHQNAPQEREPEPVALPPAIREAMEAACDARTFNDEDRQELERIARLALSYGQQETQGSIADLRWLLLLAEDSMRDKHKPERPYESCQHPACCRLRAIRAVLWAAPPKDEA